MPTKQASKPERIARLSVLKSCPVLKHVMSAKRDGKSTGAYWLTTEEAIKRLSNVSGGNVDDQDLIGLLITELKIDQEGRDGSEKMEKITDDFVKNFLTCYGYDTVIFDEAINLRELRKQKEEEQGLEQEQEQEQELEQENEGEEEGGQELQQEQIEVKIKKRKKKKRKEKKIKKIKVQNIHHHHNYLPDLQNPFNLIYLLMIIYCFTSFYFIYNL